MKNFTFISLHVFPFICKFFYCLLPFLSIISHLLYTQIPVVIQRFATSEDVCWNIRNVKVKPFFFPEMRLYLLMFITGVCFLFLDNRLSLFIYSFIYLSKKKIEFRLFRLFWIPSSVIPAFPTYPAKPPEYNRPSLLARYQLLSSYASSVAAPRFQ